MDSLVRRDGVDSSCRLRGDNGIMAWPFVLGTMLGGALGGGVGTYGLMSLLNRSGRLPASKVQRDQYMSNYYNEMMGGDALWDLRENYGHGAYGLPSIATHEAASGHTSDWLVDLLRGGKKERPPSNAYQFMGDVGSFGLGLINEAWNAPQYIWAGDDPSQIWSEVKEDIGSNWRGTFGRDYGTPMGHTFKEKFSEGSGQPNFSRTMREGSSTVDPISYDTRTPRTSFGLGLDPVTPINQPVDRDDFRGL